MRGPAFASPRRGTLSFVTQSSFVLVRSTTEGTLVGYSFLLSHRMGVYPGLQSGLWLLCKPLTSNTVWCPVFVISSVENQAAVGTRVTVTAMKLAEPLYQSITSRALLATLTETV